MAFMFYKCHNLRSLDLIRFDTNLVEDMSNMFNDCNSIAYIYNLDNFDTTLVTNMDFMFNNCYN